MKKIINIIVNYLWIIIPSIIVLILLIIKDLNKSLYETIDNFIVIVVLILMLSIWVYVIYTIIKNKKEKNRLYDKYGIFEINKINEFLKCEYNDEIISNDIRYDFFEFVEYSCDDFLEEVEKIEYNRKKYEKDLKKYYNLKLKDLDKYIKLSNEVMNIISIYYDDNGNRRKKPFI